jgi:hypothetical protein
MRALQWLAWWRPPCLLRAVILNLKSSDDEVIRGVLWAARGPWLTLKDCEGVKAGKPPERMRGEVIIHRSNVAFLQVLP